MISDEAYWPSYTLLPKVKFLHVCFLVSLSIVFRISCFRTLLWDDLVNIQDSFKDDVAKRSITDVKIVLGMPLKLVKIKKTNNEEMFQLQENVNQISYQFFWWQCLGGEGNFSWVHLCLGGNSASSKGNLGTKSFNWNALYKLQ